MLYSFRPRPKNLTNSEKTSTTSNLSQHRYLMIRRRSQQGTGNKLLPASSVKKDSSIASGCISTVDHSKMQCVSKGNALCNEHQYKLVTDWESEWYTCFHHFTNYKQQRRPQSWHTFKAIVSAAATEAAAELEESHLRQTELPKLLTGVKLTPRRPQNQQITTFCNLHHPQNSSTSLRVEKDSLNQSDSIQTPDPWLAKKTQCLSQNLLKSLVVSAISMPSAEIPTDTPDSTAAPNTHPRRNSWNNEYPRARPLYAKRERSKTKSAPLCMCSCLPTSKPETNQTTTYSYFSSDTDEQSTPSGGMGVSSALRAKKARELFNKPPPLLADSKPRSHWYEMRTPEFHTEARRNNDLIRNSCSCY